MAELDFGRKVERIQAMARKPKKTLADYPHLVAQLHPTKNGDIDPSQISYGSNVRLWWKCQSGKWPNGAPADDHEWNASVHHRILSASGCPFCSRKKACLSNCLAATHTDLAAQWHPQKNGPLTPFDIVSGKQVKVWWKCDNGQWPDGSPADDHEWEATPTDRTSARSGCPCCHRVKAVPSNCLATTHPDLAAEWHSEKNGCLTPNDVTSSGKMVWWKCNNGKWPDGTLARDHEWQATVNDRVKGNGCPCCSGRKAVPSNCLATTHPELAAQWCSDRNGSDRASDVTYGSHFMRWWKCNRCDGNVWLAPVKDRAAGHGCPKCNHSRGEAKISEYLSRQRLVHEFQWRPNTAELKRCRYDFMVDRWGNQWLIEFHGRQHYMPEGFGSKKEKEKYRNLIWNIRQDHRKEKWAAMKGMPLLVIPYWDFDRIGEILDEFFFLERMPIISEPPAIVKKYEPMRQKILERINA